MWIDRMMNTTMNDGGRRLEEAEVLARVAGLRMDEERLTRLAEAMERAAGMTTTLEQVGIEPTDLALDPFDPAWPESSSR